MVNTLTLEKLEPATYSELAGIVARGYAMRWLSFRGPLWLLLLVRHPINLGVRFITSCSLLAELWSAIFLMMFGVQSLGWGWKPLMFNYPQVYKGITSIMSIESLSVIVTILGVVQFATICVGNIRPRRYVSFIVFNIWLLMCVMFFRGINDIPPIVAIAFPPATIVSFLCYIALSAREEFGNGRTP